MDITPLIPKGRQVITGYGDGGFTLNGERIDGSILLLPERVTQLSTQSLSDIDFGTLMNELADTELLLIGTGKMLVPLDPAIRQMFRAKHISVETMDSGAACRTYNVVLSEERRVAAVLIAI